MAIPRDHDVVGLEIAMNDARRVSLGQSFGNVLQMAQKLGQTDSLSVNLSAERLTINELHRDEVHSGGFTNLVDMRDLRMI